MQRSFDINFWVDYLTVFIYLLWKAKLLKAKFCNVQYCQKNISMNQHGFDDIHNQCSEEPIQSCRFLWKPDWWNIRYLIMAWFLVMHGIQILIAMIRVIVFKKIWRDMTIIEFFLQRSIAKKKEVRARSQQVQTNLTNAALMMLLNQYEMDPTHKGSVNEDPGSPRRFSSSRKHSSPRRITTSRKHSSPVSTQSMVPLTVKTLFRSQKDHMPHTEYDQISLSAKLPGRGNVFLPTDPRETEIAEPNLGNQWQKAPMGGPSARGMTFTLKNNIIISPTKSGFGQKGKILKRWVGTESSNKVHDESQIRQGMLCGSRSQNSPVRRKPSNQVYPDGPNTPKDNQYN